MAQQREGRLVNEWLWKTYPTKLQWKRVRLGQTPNKVEAAYYKVHLRWADAIVINDMDVVIIEGKIRPGFGALGQLEAYKELFKKTPEFMDYWNRNIKLVLLTAWHDENIKTECERKNIDYVFFQPDWIKPYLAQILKVDISQIK